MKNIYRKDRTCAVVNVEEFTSGLNIQDARVAEESRSREITCMIENTAIDQCCELREWFLKEYEEEMLSSQKYDNAAVILDDISDEIGIKLGHHISGLMERMGKDEFQHMINLMAMAELLNESCRCDKQDVVVEGGKPEKFNIFPSSEDRERFRAAAFGEPKFKDPMLRLGS